MIRFLMSSFLTLFLFPAIGQASWELFPLGVQTRFESQPDSDLVSKNALHLSAGYVWQDNHAQIEWAVWDEATGSSYVGVDRRHEEWVFWWKRDWVQLGRFDLHTGLAGGLAIEQLRSRLDGQQIDDDGGWQPLGAAAVGVGWRWESLRLIGEARLFVSPDLVPNPQPDFLLKAGFVF